MTKGIDISAYQKNVDYSKTGVDFAILRAGYGRLASQKDLLFERHYNGFKTAGIAVGAYWYSYARTVDEAKAEARACIEVLKNKQLEFPIYYDVEEQEQYKLGKAKVSAIIRAFCEELESANYWVGIYTNASWYNSVLEDDLKSRYAIWIAHWDVSRPGIAGPYGLWQYKVGKQAGVAGDCDLDYAYEDYPTLIKQAGKNGYKAEPEPAKKTIDISITINGKTYAGKLTELTKGYLYTIG